MEKRSETEAFTDLDREELIKIAGIASGTAMNSILIGEEYRSCFEGYAFRLRRMFPESEGPYRNLNTPSKP